jgi:dihydroflavonol-4-reductase
MLGARHRVRLLVRNPARLGSLRDLDVEVHEGDILSEKSLVHALVEVDAVVNCAACVSLRPRDRSLIQRANIDGTRNVLEAAAARGLRILHTSSIAAVGPTATPVVLDETAGRAELGFDYPYAASKRESEDIALDYARRGADVVVLNPGIMLGPDDLYFSSTEFVMRYLRSQLGVHLPGGGSFCDVRDVAPAYVTALTAARRGERYLLAGVNRGYGEVMEELRRLTGLQRSTTMPRPLAEWTALWSELGSALWPHPLEKFNLSVVRWGSLFNFCAVEKAARELGYRNRPFTDTLTDTVLDLLERGVVEPATPELQALFAREEVPRRERARPAPTARRRARAR